MFSYKVKTLYFFLSLLVLFKINCGFSLNRSKRSLLEISVLSPSQFNVRLPEETLLNFRVNINKELSDSEAADFEKNKTDGNILEFSRSDLNLRRGDNFYYHGLFEASDGSLQGEAGVYIFNGVFKAAKKQKREVTVEVSEDNSSPKAVEYRFGDYGGRGYDHHNHFGPPHLHHPPNGPPHGHFHAHFHGHSHGSPYDVSPFHTRPGKSPYFYSGYQPFDFWGWLAKYKPFWSPDSWNGRGHGHRNKFRPWCHGDGNDSDNEEATKRPSDSGPEIEPTTKSIVTPPTTNSTTKVPKIDIRFPDVER